MYLGIDLGTSSIKLILIDEDKNIIAETSEGLLLSTPKPLFSEQNPEDWWQAFLKAMAKLDQIAHTYLIKIKAIGLSGQQHGAVLLDKNGNVLRNAILWNDGRSFKECIELEQIVPDFEEITGNRIMPGFTAPKLLWVLRNEPHLFAKINKVLLPKDYLRYRLTGEYASDLSDSSGTSWIDTGQRKWSKRMLDATHLTIEHMPKLYEGNQITGHITQVIANLLHLPYNTKVVAGAGDNAASAMSLNVIESGRGFLSLGTSGVYFVPSKTYFNAGGGVHTFCHAVPNIWHHMAVHLNAASALNWWSGICNEPIEKLVKEAENSNSHSKVIFLPYLTGERTPYNDPHAKGVFIGMGANTTTADLTNAVLRGISMAFMTGQETILNSKVSIGSIAVVGGGARNTYWGKLLASALNRPLEYTKNREIGAAYGAAILAWMGYNNSMELVNPDIEMIIEPNLALNQEFERDFVLFKETYTNLKPIFSKLNS